MIPQLLLLADDLTGAADCAAYAPGAGLRAAIHLGMPHTLAPGLNALTTHSRALIPQHAATAVRLAIAAHTALPAAHCFKKIDSQLRGNVGAEVAAMLEMLAAPAALICPALPAQGRSVLDGRLARALGGERIANVLAAQSTLPQAHIGLDTVRAEPAALLMMMKAATVDARMVIADAQSDADLDALVAAWQSSAPAGLLCGSAGLAAAWLRAHAPANAQSLSLLDSPPPVDFVVVGSASAMAHAQIAAATALPKVHVVAVRAGALPKPSPGTRLFLHLPAAATAPTQAERSAAAEMLADAATAYMQRVPVHHLLVAGGDTAQAVLARLGITRLNVLRAALPGMPTCRAQRASAPPLWITLKAGNHGNGDAIARLMQA